MRIADGVALMAVLPFCCVKEPPEISQLRAMMDKPMRVKVTDGRILTGNFHCFDNLRNIMLSDTKEALHENGDPLAGRSVSASTAYQAAWVLEPCLLVPLTPCAAQNPRTADTWAWSSFRGSGWCPATWKEGGRREIGPA
eukprot:COSAG01_NODE_1784_length_9237_cov_11.706829_5_plen_140_part_00